MTWVSNNSKFNEIKWEHAGNGMLWLAKRTATEGVCLPAGLLTRASGITMFDAKEVDTIPASVFDVPSYCKSGVAKHKSCRKY